MGGMNGANPMSGGGAMANHMFGGRQIQNPMIGRNQGNGLGFGGGFGAPMRRSKENSILAFSSEDK